MDKLITPQYRHKDAESLGLYSYLADLQAEWEKYKANLFLYPHVVAQAIIGEIGTIKKMINSYETAEWIAEQATIEGQLQLNDELDKAAEMKVSA
jgi:hypothetical protein